MCRNIKPLFNFDPPTTEEEAWAAALQFVRKITGVNTPSKVNETSFLQAVDDIASRSLALLRSLQSKAPPKKREEELVKARARSATRYGTRHPRAAD